MEVVGARRNRPAGGSCGALAWRRKVGPSFSGARAAAGYGLAVLLWLFPTGLLGQEAAESTREPGAETSCELELRFGRDSVIEDETVSLHLIVRNSGSEPLHDLKAEDIVADGLTPAGHPRFFEVIPVLPSGDQRVLSTKLRVTDSRPGKRSVVVPFVFKRADAERRRSVAADLTVAGRWSEVRRPGLFFFVDLLKGLALPLAVGLLGLVGRYLIDEKAAHAEKEQKREERWQARRQAKRDEELERVRRARLERLEALKQFLSRVLGITQRHYLPIGSAVLGVQDDFERYQEEATEARLDSLLASLVVLSWRDDHLTRRVGGWIFQHRGGEKLVHGMWNDFKSIRNLWLERDNLRRLVNQFRREPRYIEIVDRFARTDDSAPSSSENRAHWDAVRADLDRWAHNPELEAAIAALRTFNAVLMLEVNRVYTPLYGLADDFTAAEMELSIQRLDREKDHLVDVLETKLGSGHERIHDALRPRIKAIEAYLSELRTPRSMASEHVEALEDEVSEGADTPLREAPAS